MLNLIKKYQLRSYVVLLTMMSTLFSVNSVIANSISSQVPMTKSHPGAHTNLVDDKIIVATIEKKISANSLLAHQAISVVSNQGVVTLKGLVNTSHEATEVLRIAETVAGVKHVDATGLKVKSTVVPGKIL